MRYISFLAALILCLGLTACSDTRAADVDAFNSASLEQLARYEKVQDITQDKEIELIRGIISGDLSSFPTSDNLDISEAHDLIANITIPDGMDTTPLVQSSDLYTSLDTDVLTQYVLFIYCGTPFKLQILWTDKIDTIALEVRNSATR